MEENSSSHSAVTLLAVVVVIVSLVAIGYLVKEQSKQPSLEPTVSASPAADAVGDATYTIDGHPIKLTGGKSEQSIVPGSASKLVTRIFGNEAVGDLNGDGIADTILILTQSTGGSGDFFYVAAAVKDGNGKYHGTNAMLLGDRIAPQPSTVTTGVATINYATRAKGESMTTRPSIGVSRSFFVVDGELKEIMPLPSVPPVEATSTGTTTLQYDASGTASSSF